MGICHSRKNFQNPMNTNPTSYYSSNPSILQKITNTKESIQKPNLNFIIPCQPTNYDPSNPHRQFNVLINGVRFEIINSIENCIFSIENLEE
ncbi:unnamed protein product [Paramecium sonneborni]|uniref:Uncharacterized protein n=1 Tax=Paramecium sonneborni TaxID=65129 RepID=A0A8S1LK66_9CILI|nr:unnamed protein product [Paramecium sonneborni]